MSLLLLHLLLLCMCLNFGNNFPGEDHLAYMPAASRLGLWSGDTVFFGIDQDKIQRLVCACECANEDAAICSSYTHNMA